MGITGGPSLITVLKASRIATPRSVSSSLARTFASSSLPPGS